MNGSQSLDNASKELSANQRAPLMPQVRDQLPESSKLFKIFLFLEIRARKLKLLKVSAAGRHVSDCETRFGSVLADLRRQIIEPRFSQTQKQLFIVTEISYSR